MHINVMFYASNCNTKLTLKNFPGVSLHCTPFRPAPLRFVQGRYVRPSPAGSPSSLHLRSAAVGKGLPALTQKNSAANSSAATATLHSAAPFFGMLLFPCNCSIKIGLRRTVSLNLHRCRMQTADAIRLFFIAKL